MPIIINAPTIIKAAGNKPKIIEEYFGRVNSKNGSGKHCKNDKSTRLD